MEQFSLSSKMASRPNIEGRKSELFMKTSKAIITEFKCVRNIFVWFSEFSPVWKTLLNHGSAKAVERDHSKRDHD